MYDMGAASRNGLKHALSPGERKRIIAQAAEQRYAEFLGGNPLHRRHSTRTDGRIHADRARILRILPYAARGVHPDGATPRTTTHPTLTSNVKFMNFYPFADIETISPRPLLFIAGENAHSREFSENAYRLAAEPKELYLVPDAGHVDLYDRTGLIPFGKLETFFRAALK